MTTIAVLPGDGIGPEIAAPAVQVLSELLGAEVEFQEYVFGGASIDAHGTALTDDTLAGCRASDAVLLAAVGGPKWDTTDPNAPRPEQGLLGCARNSASSRTSARPADPGALLRLGPQARGDRRTNLVVVRELTGGIYFGEKTRTETSASDLCSYTTHEVERIARVAFELAGRRLGKLASVDKANVLETSRQWRQVVHEVAADYPAIELEDVLVDNCAMQLISRPSSFDVIVTENLFGDILSDEAAMLTGPSACCPAPRSASPAPRACSSPSTARPRHRRPGHREPAGHVPLGRDAAP